MMINSFQILGALTVVSVTAFVPNSRNNKNFITHTQVGFPLSFANQISKAYFVEQEVVEEAVREERVTIAAVPHTPAREEPKKKKLGKRGEDGVFTPLVITAKKVLGEEQLNKLRAKGISIHSDVIKSFVETSSAPFGQAALERIFEIADRNKDGSIDEEEMKAAVNTLGFTWLQDKQIGGIMKRADKDKNGVIDNHFKKLPLKSKKLFLKIFNKHFKKEVK